MLQLRFAYALKAMGLNQFYDALEAGSDIGREGIECGLGLPIGKSDGSSHGVSIPFLQCSSRWRGKEKQPSGVKTLFPKGRCVAGDESPAYRSGPAEIPRPETLEDGTGRWSPRCPNARHLGHPSSVVVLTSAGTWAARQWTVTLRPWIQRRICFWLLRNDQ